MGFDPRNLTPLVKEVGNTFTFEARKQRNQDIRNAPCKARFDIYGYPYGSEVDDQAEAQRSITMESEVAPNPERISLMLVTKLFGPQI